MEEKSHTAKHKSRNSRDAIVAIAVVVALYIFLGHMGIGCPIRFLTGISCAGCGMTRAWLYLLAGDLQNAFSAHPLWWLVLPTVLLIWQRRKMPRKLYLATIWIIIISFMAVYIARMLFSDGSIVYFRPAEGLIGRVALRLYSFIGNY